MIVGGVLIGLMPWAYGGRNATWMLVAAATLALSAWLLLRQKKPVAIATLPLAAAATAWIGWGALSLLWSVNQYQSYIWLLYALLAVAAFVVTANFDRDQKRLLITGYVLTAAGTALIGLVFYLTGDYERLTATFYWANPAAAYLLPAIFIAAAKSLTPNTKLQPSRRLQATVITVLLLVAFWLTDSRGAALVMLLVGVPGLAVSPLRKHWRRMALILIGSFTLAWGVAAVKPLIHSSGYVLAPGSRYAAAKGESSSLHQRVDYLTSAASAWWDRPLLGSGAGTFGTIHPQYQQKVVSATNDAHNIYLQTLSEQGIVGAVLLAWLLILVVAGLARGLRHDSTKLTWALGALALILHFGLDIDARYLALLLLLAVLLGSVYKPMRQVEPNPRRRFALPLVLVIATGLALANYLSNLQQAKGEIYNSQHDLPAAAAAYKQAHSYWVADPDTYTAEGIDYFVLASFTGGSKQFQDQALDRANNAIKLDPNDAQHYFLRGRIKRLAGDLPAAQSDIEKALSLDRFNHADYYADLISIQLQRSNFDGAGRTVDSALKLYTDAVIADRSADSTLKPAVASILSVRASHLESIGDIVGAKQVLDRAILLDPTNRDAMRVKAALN